MTMVKINPSDIVDLFVNKQLLGSFRKGTKWNGLIEMVDILENDKLIIMEDQSLGTPLYEIFTVGIERISEGKILCGSRRIMKKIEKLEVINPNDLEDS